MLQGQAKRLHATCAAALSDLPEGIDAGALARHHDKGGTPFIACGLYLAKAKQLRAVQAGLDPERELLLAAEQCMKRCPENDERFKLELLSLHQLLSTYPDSETMQRAGGPSPPTHLSLSQFAPHTPFCAHSYRSFATSYVVSSLVLERIIPVLFYQYRQFFTGIIPIFWDL